MATTPKSISGLTSAAAARVVLWQSREFITVPGNAMGLQALNANLTQLADLGTINLTGGQIKFPATQNPSADANTLDDYERGTWTGTATAGTGTFTTVSVVDEVYIKIGDLVHVHCRVNITTVGSAGSDIRVAGLPFNVSAGITYVGSCRENAVSGMVGMTMSGYSSATDIGAVPLGAGFFINGAVILMDGTYMVS